MGTRAVYTFFDGPDGPSYGPYHVYKHFDGYPAGAVSALENALPYAWELPRYEADEFAAAFVAGNKPNNGGNIRLMAPQTRDMPAAEAARAFAMDIEFRYEIRLIRDALHVTVFDVNYWERIEEKQIFAGTLAKMKVWAEKASE